MRKVNHLIGGEAGIDRPIPIAVIEQQRQVPCRHRWPHLWAKMFPNRQGADEFAAPCRFGNIFAHKCGHLCRQGTWRCCSITAMGIGRSMPASPPMRWLTFRMLVRLERDDAYD